MAEAQAGTQPQGYTPETTELSLLDQIVDQGRVGRDAATRERGKDMIKQFVNEVLDGQITMARDTEAMINARIAQIDAGELHEPLAVVAAAPLDLERTNRLRGAGRVRGPGRATGARVCIAEVSHHHHRFLPADSGDPPGAPGLQARQAVGQGLSGRHAH